MSVRTVFIYLFIYLFYVFCIPSPYVLGHNSFHNKVLQYQWPVTTTLSAIFFDFRMIVWYYYGEFLHNFQITHLGKRARHRAVDNVNNSYSLLFSNVHNFTDTNILDIIVLRHTNCTVSAACLQRHFILFKKKQLSGVCICYSTYLFFWILITTRFRLTLAMIIF